MNGRMFVLASGIVILGAANALQPVNAQNANGGVNGKVEKKRPATVECLRDTSFRYKTRQSVSHLWVQETNNGIDQGRQDYGNPRAYAITPKILPVIGVPKNEGDFCRCFGSGILDHRDEQEPHLSPTCNFSGLQGTITWINGGGVRLGEVFTFSN